MKNLFFLLVCLCMSGSMLAKPADTDTIPVHIVNPGWDCQISNGEAGTWFLSGYSADSMYFVNITNEKAVSRVTGTYQSEDMDMFLTFLSDLQRTGSQMQYFAELTVQIDSADNKYIFSAIYETYAGLIYHITADSISAEVWQVPTSIDRLQKKAVNRPSKSLVDGKVTIWMNNKRYLLNGEEAK